ncbi:MAG: hypothetical protein RR993_00330 [Clostridia bacterium]
MENSRKKTLALCAIILLVVLSMTALIFATPNNAVAQNMNLKITLTAKSKFSAFGEAIAYCHNNTIFVAQNDKIVTLSNAYVGECKDIAMNGKHIVTLSTTNKLGLFEYSATAVTKIDDPYAGFEYLTEKDFATAQHIFANAQGEFFYQDSSQVNAVNFETKKVESQYTAKNDIFNFSCVTIANDTLVGTSSDGKLFAIGQKTQIKDATLDNFLLLSDNSYTTLCAIGDKLFANSGSGIFSINTREKTSTKLLDTPSKNGAVQAVTFNGEQYVFVLCANDLSIKMYLSLDNSLTYINSFDNTEYSHPTNCDILTAARMTVNTSVFVSPRHLQVVFSLKANEIALLLAKQDNYFYITDGKGNFGYIHSATATQPLSSESETIFGSVAQGLHQNTKIYQYPFETAEVLETVDIFKRLEVVRDVATESGVSVWGWLEIKYINADKTLARGFVKYNDISPYTEIQAPALKKDAKVKTGKFGSVANIYALPNEQSKILSTLADGSKITLIKKYDPTSEWMAVQVGEEVGYIKTAQIQLNGLTNVQLLSIISVSVLVAVTIVIVTIFAIKRRKKF